MSRQIINKISENIYKLILNLKITNTKLKLYNFIIHLYIYNIKYYYVKTKNYMYLNILNYNNLL